MSMGRERVRLPRGGGTAMLATTIMQGTASVAHPHKLGVVPVVSVPPDPRPSARRYRYSSHHHQVKNPTKLPRFEARRLLLVAVVSRHRHRRVKVGPGVAGLQKASPLLSLRLVPLPPKRTPLRKGVSVVVVVVVW